VKFFAGISVFVDETEALAQARYEDYKRYSSFEGLIGLMSGAMGIDLSKYSLDEPIQYAPNDANRSALEAFTRNNAWTLRQVLDAKALCGTNVAVVGTASQVADEMSRWMAVADVDGFNIARIVAHETMENFIAMVVPELQRRGLYKTAYRPGTFREKLLGHGPGIRDHPAASYYNRATSTAS
jgi:long-chain alkane monooxygenase